MHKKVLQLIAEHMSCDNASAIHSGCSVRGTLTEVLEELDENSLSVLKEIANTIKL